jgi:hypothetical protein
MLPRVVSTLLLTEKICFYGGVTGLSAQRLRQTADNVSSGAVLQQLRALKKRWETRNPPVFRISLRRCGSTVGKPYSPARYATNKTAKLPSMTAMAVIATVRFAGPKKISRTMANFSMAAAVKIGARLSGKYALYTVSAQTTKSSAPQCRKRNIVTPSVFLAPNTNCKTC